jgi:5-methylcytosine-specific restriction protein B
MIEHKDEDRVCVVQFHPNYTYEDFIIGYKPCDDGKFQLKPGVFMKFCQEAAKDENKDNNFFFIIDEINRGNLSKIFGEAFTLIEKDHRGESIKLANSDNGYKELEIPENVYIIGLMNTADRSLAMLDYALMRRFEFLPLEPAFDTKSFKIYQKSLNNDLFNKVIKCIVDLNKKIANNSALGEGFCIGHSYFCISKDRKKEYEECIKDIKAWLKNVIHYEIIPILRAYCFDGDKKFDELSTPLIEVFK